MLTPRQQHALDCLPRFEADYYESCALLNVVNLTPTQRLARQKIVRLRLAAMNRVREAAGLVALDAPRLLTVDELLQPAGNATPEALRAALVAAESQPSLFCVVAQYEGTSALAA